MAGVNGADWPYLFCRADSLSETVWVNRIGAFGVASAPCRIGCMCWDVRWACHAGGGFLALGVCG